MMISLCLRCVLLTVCVLEVCIASDEVSFSSEDFDYRTSVSQADFVYHRSLALDQQGQPIADDGSASVDGIPLGNGRMAGLVRGIPDGIFVQVNRPDVLGANSYTAQKSTELLANGCGQVLVDLGAAPFSASDVRQGLSHYDALGTFDGGGVRVRALVAYDVDVLALEVTDTRERPQPITVTLRMLREPRVESGPRPFVALSEFQLEEGAIVLTQTYHEPAAPEFPIGEHYCRSALAARIVGRPGQPVEVDERNFALKAAPGRGRFLILVSSASTLDRNVDAVANALRQESLASKKGFDRLLADNQLWWHDFWGRSYLELHSETGEAEFLARSWTAWLYQMACTSRGKLVPHWNYGLWYSSGDWRSFWRGPKYWGWNLMAYYRALPAANHLELVEPFFNLYSGAYENGRWHAEFVRGAKDGVFFSETIFWNGSRKYPRDVADEFRRYLLSEIQYEDLSKTTKRYADIALRSEADDIGFACHPDAPRPYFYHTHCFSTGAKVAWRFWLAYEFNQDLDWLRNRAYPVIRAMAEFYRNYPNVKKEVDGKYHIYNVHSHEPVWGGQDTMEELCAMRAMTALAARASEILGVDEEIRPLWRDIYENTTDIPSTSEHDVLALPHDETTPEIWAQARNPVAYHHLIESATPTRPVVDYDLLTLETDTPQARLVAKNSLRANPWYHDLMAGNATFCLSEIPSAVVLLGDAELVRRILPKQLSGVGWRDNIRLRKNHIMACPSGNITNEGLGYSADNVQQALLQSISPTPGGEPVIHVFPAWPMQWDARFKLAARRGFLVTALREDGVVGFVRINAQFGGVCRIRNPWPNSSVELARNGESTETLRGSLLVFQTSVGERILLVRKNGK